MSLIYLSMSDPVILTIRRLQIKHSICYLWKINKL